MGNIETLYQARQWTEKPIFLFAEKYISWLIPQGKHKIIIDQDVSNYNCGLIPIGEPCDHVTTTGLKWNLTNQRLKFGELVSTSNTYNGTGAVTIDTDKPLVWTMEI